MTKKKTEEPVVLSRATDLPPMPGSLGSMRVNKTASWRSIRPVIIEAKCKRCMLCWKYCPEPAIEAGDPPVVDYDYCKGCGICIAECPFGAIESEKEGR